MIYNAKAYINGEFIDSNNRIESISPINGNVIGSYPALSKEQIDYAYESAHKAFLSWSNLNHENRINFIEEFAKELLLKKDLLSKLLTLEIGKSHKDSVIEIERTFDYIEKTIHYYKNFFLLPKIIDEKDHNIKNKIGKFYYVPIGVVLAIAPFNYPINLSIAKIIPSLISGNTVVFKPASQGSLSGLVLSEIFNKINIPKGVVNIVTGKGSEIGDYIVENKYVKGITFTGGTQVGLNIAKKASLKNLVLELGGKDPAIVLDDIDVEKVAKQIIAGAFNYSGQRCTAIKRVLVLDSIADKLVNELEKEIRKLTFGNPFDNVDIVPLISKKELEFVQLLINDSLTNGAKLVYGNEIVGFNLMKPTLIDNVSLNSRLAWEEPFGPVLPIIRVNDINEIIKISNHSEYGLQASIFTLNKEKAIYIANKLEVGTVNINASSSRGPDIFPFIGVKNSGFGVQGIVDSIKSMTRIKGIVENN